VQDDPRGESWGVVTYEGKRLTGVAAVQYLANARSRKRGRLYRIWKVLQTSLALLYQLSGIRISLQELRNLPHRIRVTRKNRWDVTGLPVHQLQASVSRLHDACIGTGTVDYMLGIKALEDDGLCATMYDHQLFLLGYYWAQAEQNHLAHNAGRESYTTSQAIQQGEP
jgi:hypothetical protein